MAIKRSVALFTLFLVSESRVHIPGKVQEVVPLFCRYKPGGCRTALVIWLTLAIFLPEEEVDTGEKGPYVLQSELEKAIKEMRNRKATGDDDVLEMC